ncbi:DUF4270 family protein [Mucilaginibacter terrae]|uniref:DUF4270 domain-containing protein n=1 Tax=Mucilaginibacter terrae TaxID=1955052 RepID=A0ABU3GVD5_9SPHI|nr:DUF4270 family protein [Mucilaginibacter terrae]MDT3403446.1 hypothetical protein [Mucilaginibacter terrae]
MKFIRLDLLTLLISLFILSSCKNQNDIGLPVGDQQINGSLLVYDDITVKTDTDNVTTSSRVPGASNNPAAKTPLASLNDPRFGELKSIIATGLNLPNSSAYTIPTGTITTDSVVLELRYAQGFYGDSLASKFKVNVYRLKEKPAGRFYPSNYHWEKEADNFINTSKAGPYNARPNTNVRITDIRTGKPDSIKNVLPHLRVSLNPSKITPFIFEPAYVTSNTTFQNQIKGLYIELQRNQTSEVGANLMLNLDSSAVKVYYRANNAGTIDTGIVTLTMGTHTSEISRTFSSEIQTALAKANGTTNDLFYIQGMLGLRTRVGFPNVKTMFGNVDLKTIAITRAELVISPEPGTDNAPFIAQPQLTLYRLGNTLQRQQLPDANGTSQTSGDPRFLGAAAFGGNFIKASKEYHFLVTGYLQDLISGKTQDYGTYVGAIDTLNRSSVVDISPSFQSPGRLIATGSKKTSATRIKLNVIYTKNN